LLKSLIITFWQLKYATFTFPFRWKFTIASSFNCWFLCTGRAGGSQHPQETSGLPAGGKIRGREARGRAYDQQVAS
jgi:hypothetical protein